MEEQFRQWNPRTMLSVTYTSTTGEKKLFQIDQMKLLACIQKIIATYQSQNITLTNRQLYYQLVSADIVPNAVEIYNRLCVFLTDARYGGQIDWDALEDRSRVPEKHPEWDSVSDLIDSAVATYRLPRWKDQKYYLEIFCEKQAMESVLKPVAEKYHTYFGYNKGYSSAATMYELAKRLGEQINEGKECVILYFGDHDSSGLDMVRDIRERVEEFLTEGDKYIEPNFEVVQLALNYEQVKQYKPPPNPAKMKDPRAVGYIAQYGRMSWELDALNPKILRDIAVAGIHKYIDIDNYHDIIAKEELQKKRLKKLAEKIDKETDESD